MLVSPLFRNMPTHFPLLLREPVVTATTLQDYREGIVPSRSGQPSKFTFTCDGGHPAGNDRNRRYSAGPMCDPQGRFGGQERPFPVRADDDRDPP